MQENPLHVCFTSPHTHNPLLHHSFLIGRCFFPFVIVIPLMIVDKCSRMQLTWCGDAAWYVTALSLTWWRGIKAISEREKHSNFLKAAQRSRENNKTLLSFTRTCPALYFQLFIACGIIAILLLQIEHNSHTYKTRLYLISLIVSVLGCYRVYSRISVSTFCTLIKKNVQGKKLCFSLFTVLEMICIVFITARFAAADFRFIFRTPLTRLWCPHCSHWAVCSPAERREGTAPGYLL